MRSKEIYVAVHRVIMRGAESIARAKSHEKAKLIARALNAYQDSQHTRYYDKTSGEEVQV